MLKLLKIRLSLAIIISLLLLSIVVSFSAVAVSDFFQYQKAVDKSLQLDLKRFHFFVKNVIEREKIKFNASKPLPDDKTPLKTFSLTIDQKDIIKLDSNLPQSGKEQYVDAYMKVSDDKKIKKVKLRYRGDSNYHWLYAQKSLRIKLSTNDIYNMEKTFNLINPPSMYSFRDIINYKLSKKLGIISPDCSAVRVKINGRYMGIYLYISQVDESLLRKHKLMPGSIYYGDVIGHQLWKDSSLWAKKSARNAEQKKIREDINFYINAINNYNDTEFYEFVETYLNKQKFFSFIALDRLLGTHHHDYTHNHKLYFDPYKGKFEPISWDIRFWLDMKAKDLSLYPLVLRISSNPIYDAQIDKIVFDLIKNGTYEQIMKDYQKTISLIIPDLESDIYKDRALNLPYVSSKAISEPFEVKQLERLVRADLGTLKSRKKFLINLLNQAKISYDVEVINSNKIKLLFEVKGNSPVNVKFPDKSELTLYPEKKIIENSQKLFPTAAWGTKTVKNFAKKYQFVFNLNTTDKSIQNFLSKIEYTNFVTNKKLEATKVDLLNDNIKLKTDAWQLINKKHKVKILKGVVEVDKTMVFDRFTEVIIKAGTIFKIAPKQSLYFYNKVTAVGTEKEPIKFIAKNSNKPWGLVAVQGEAASGSVFKYCEFKDGSIDTKNLIHYTSPFNLHQLDFFEVSHCKIGKNFIGDDSMHIAYSKGVVDNCLFENARSDGLDIDISDVNITNNIFYNSGNDALDIMTTKMFASNNQFINTGDKGISVGEWSEAKITDSYFLNNEIGLEIKDKSVVDASNLTFENAKSKAINLYNKNKRYNRGGTLKAKSLHFIGNKIVSKDKRSSYEIR